MCACAAESLSGATHVVTNLDDGGPGSLREELASANAGDTISFAISGTIVLTNGELSISNSLKIAGPGSTNLAISAAGQSRVLEIFTNAAVKLSGLTICDGHAANGAAGTSNSPAGGDGRGGGGIYNAGLLTMEQCIISNCAAGKGGAGYITHPTDPAATNWIGGAGGCGGAIYNAGRLSLTGSQLILNSSGAGGNAGSAGEYGAAANAGGSGGAIYNTGRMALAACAFDSNVAGRGGDAGYNGLMGSFDGGNPGGAGGNGGAVCDAGQATTSISDCQFNSNASGSGGMGNTMGGVAYPLAGGAGGGGGNGGAIWAAVPVRINDSLFVLNQAGFGGSGGFGVNSGGAGGLGGPGGAIWAGGGLTMARCYCTSNSAGLGGSGGTSPNTAGSGDGGGPGGAVYAVSAVTLEDSTFNGNVAGPGGAGARALSSNSSNNHPVPGAGGLGGYGGALCCESNLTATQCTFANNQAGNAGGPGSGAFSPNFNFQSTAGGSDGGQGGGIFGAGPTFLRACTVSGNLGGRGSSAGAGAFAAAAISGGRLDANPSPKIIIYTVIGGPGGGGGTGGIYSENSLNVVLCTVSGNEGGSGGWGGHSAGGYMEYIDGGAGGSGGPGAVCCPSSNLVTLVACTIASNSGGPGGTGGSGVTVPDQSGRTGQGAGGDGGAGGILDTNIAADASSINSIIASNFGGTGGAGGPYRGSSGSNGAPDIQGAFTSLGYNLIGQADGSSGFTNAVNGDLVGSANAPVDPVLGPLADNGGLTFTMALLHGSPALDAGDNALLQPPYSLKTDQRGFPRKSGPRVDIGAFEFQGRGNRPPREMILSGTLFQNGSLASNAKTQGPRSGTPIATAGLQLTFGDNTPGATYSVLATTNASLPLNGWILLGQPVQISPGVFQFNDVGATSYPQRFYRVSSP
jgi:hypothetical protein